jgi:carbonic anhydrase
VEGDVDPVAALRRLQEGNERFVNDRAEGPGRDRKRWREIAAGQQPFAIILGCADSRVAPEIAFDSGLGELFVIRVAGNVANRSSIASIEYAAANLGTKLVVVLAHESCGAVGAVVEGGEASRNLTHLLAHIQPALDAAGDRSVDVVARHNARLNAERLVVESRTLRRAVEDGGVRIVTAFYNLRTGVVDFD